MKHLFRPLSFLLLSLFLLLFSARSLFALQAVRLETNGVIELDNHQKIQLAGIQLDEEALKSISVILSHKDIHLEEEKNLANEAHPDVHFYYVHVNALEMNLPYRPSESAKETMLMVNELLVSLGLAKVDREHPFKHKARFEELEEQAKQKGRGIWSYEPLYPLKKA